MGEVIRMPKPKHEYLEHYRVCFDREAGRRLRFARRHMGLNQGQLASLLGVSHDHIKRIEDGKTQVSHFNALAFRTVFRGRVDFILFAEHREMYGYRTPEELNDLGKFWVKQAGG